MSNQTKPKIKIKSDYDNYFKSLVERWIESKLLKGNTCKHNKIIISAGPWRSEAVTYSSDGQTIHFDFYAALRRGFGSLTNKEIEEIIEII